MSIFPQLRRSRPPAPAKAPDPQKEPSEFSLTRGEWLAVLIGGVPVALAGVVLSAGGMYGRASQAYDTPELGALVPFAVDGLILFGILGWIAALRAGRRGAGFRLLAHLGVALTIYLNASAAASPADIPWHIGGPIAWSLISEVVAHHIAARRRDALGQEADSIPLRLWLSSFREQWRTVLRMARTGERSARKARAEADAGQAAIRALRLVKIDRKIRRELRSRVLAGSLTALEVFALIDRMAPAEAVGTDGSDGTIRLSVSDRALLETLRTAATRGGEAGTDGSDGRDGSERMGRSDGSASHSERVGMDGPNGWVEPLGLDRVNAARVGSGRPAVSALNGSANGSGRVASAVRSAGRKASSGDPDAARPEDIETAHRLIEAEHLGATPTADEIVSAFRAHANGLGLAKARDLREYLHREHRETA